MRTKMQALGITQKNDWLLSLNAPHHHPLKDICYYFRTPGILINITRVWKKKWKKSNEKKR